jgi:hypothetical protein
MSSKKRSPDVLMMGAMLMIGLITGFVVTFGFYRAFTGEKSPAPIRSDIDLAEDALIGFLGALHDRDYAKAIPLYGGSYDVMRDWNPDTDPSDHLKLWQRACEENGLNCLDIRNIRFASRPDDQTFIFHVWFTNRDGYSEFTPFNGQSMFDFTVRKTSGAYRVLTTPIYTP